MSRLFRKMIRDLAREWGSFAACAAVMALGAAAYGALGASYDDLGRSYQATYRNLRFLDFYVKVAQAPPAATRRVAQIPGVAAVEGRPVHEAVVELAGGRKLVGRLVGLPVGRRPAVNDLYLERGRYLDAREPRGVILERAFAEYHRLGPGDTLHVVSGKHRYRLRVIGVATSPEYLWAIADREQLMPSHQSFGVIFASSRTVQAISGRPGNSEIHVRVADPDRRPALMEEAVRRLAAYGAREAVPREEQPSHKLLQQDRAALARIAVLFPVFFLVVGACVLHALLARLLLRQRPQIGILMALGFSPRQILRHYLAGALTVGLAGSAAGSLGGHFLGNLSSRFYIGALALPYAELEIHWERLVVGSMVGTGVAGLAGWLAARKVLEMKPAQALYGTQAAESRRFHWTPGGGLPYLVRVPVRNLLRHPPRTLATVAGLALAVGQSLAAASFFDSQEDTIRFYFDQVRRHNLAVELRPAASWAELDRVSRWRGVERAEGVLMIPVRMSRKGCSYRTILVGLPRSNRTLGLYWSRREERGGVLEPDGPVLPGRDARRALHADAGAVVRANAPEGPHRQLPPDTELTLGRQLYMPIGTKAYAPLRRVRELARRVWSLPPDAVNALFLQVEPKNVPAVQERLYGEPGVAAVYRIGEARRQVYELLKLFDAYKRVLLLFAASLAFGVLFSSCSVSLLERAGELATMLTLGISLRILAVTLAVETAAVWAAGALAGLPLGYALSAWFLGMYRREGMQMELYLEPQTVAWVLGATLALSFLALGLCLRLVAGMDLAQVTRGRGR